MYHYLCFLHILLSIDYITNTAYYSKKNKSLLNNKIFNTCIVSNKKKRKRKRKQDQSTITVAHADDAVTVTEHVLKVLYQYLYTVITIFAMYKITYYSECNRIIK